MKEKTLYLPGTLLLNRYVHLDNVSFSQKEGPRIDPKTKRILERSILGTVEEYEEMMGNTRGNRRRSFQTRNTDTTAQKKDREGGATIKKTSGRKAWCRKFAEHNRQFFRR